jgi:hypothetical protein
MTEMKRKGLKSTLQNGIILALKGGKMMAQGIGEKEGKRKEITFHLLKKIACHAIIIQKWNLEIGG